MGGGGGGGSGPRGAGDREGREEGRREHPRNIIIIIWRVSIDFALVVVIIHANIVKKDYRDR